jgi:energy-coupling factor transporter ATP-binding protein EcfA2
MQVNSTGLGKTTLVSHISELSPNEGGGLMMKIESTKPVHWYITCQMEPGDVRAAMKMVLKPSVLLRILKMALGIGVSGEPEAEVAAAPATAAGKAR